MAQREIIHASIDLDTQVLHLELDGGDVADLPLGMVVEQAMRQQAERDAEQEAA